MYELDEPVVAINQRDVLLTESRKNEEHERGKCRYRLPLRPYLSEQPPKSDDRKPARKQSEDLPEDRILTNYNGRDQVRPRKIWPINRIDFVKAGRA